MMTDGGVHTRVRQRCCCACEIGVPCGGGDDGGSSLVVGGGGDGE